MSPVAAEIRAPAAWKRAALSVALLVGFYVLVLGVALTLFAIPVLFWWVRRAPQILVCIVCWIPAWVLFYALFASKVPAFEPHGQRLSESDAPELFTMLRELAAAAGTEPPGEIYLTQGVNLAVTETRRWGGRPTRYLFVGATVLMCASVDELRAGLAHELGHYAFGDTRLLGIVGSIHARFRAVLEETQRNRVGGLSAVGVGFQLARGLGEGIVKGYARFFCWLTRPSDRRAELAADELAARLVGAEPTKRLLERLELASPLYHAYLDLHVTFALSGGGIPSDLSAGFATFSSRLAERGVTRELESLTRQAKTKDYDTHPALADRLAALSREGLPGGPERADARSAVVLLSLDIDRWLANEILTDASRLLAPGRALVTLPWAELCRAVLAPKMLELARAAAGLLFPWHPEARTLGTMFAAIVRALEQGHLHGVARVVEPRIAGVHPAAYPEAVQIVAARTVSRLLTGALLERGAELHPSLGEQSFRLTFQGADVSPGVIARDAMGNEEARDVLGRWAAWFEGEPRGEEALTKDPLAT